MTLRFQTAAYLSGVLCRRTAVLEQNESGSLHSLKNIIRDGKKEKPVIDGQDSRLKLKVFIKRLNVQMVRLFGKGMEAMVIDGALTQKIRMPFSMQPLFLVGSVSRMLAGFAAFGSRKAKWKNGVSISSHWRRGSCKMAEQYLDIPDIRSANPLQKNALILRRVHLFGKFLR